MGYPEHVLEVFEELRESQDDRALTMEMLVTPREIGCNMDADRDYPDQKQYEAMWRSLERYEKKIKGTLDRNDWVLEFLDDVIKAQKLPTYMYLKNPKRLNLVQKINELTSELSTVYIENSLNSGVRLNKALRRKDLTCIEPEKMSAVDITELLSSYSQSLIREICSAEFLSKDSEGIEERMFAFALVKRNELLYGAPLYDVIATAIWAVLERNNSASTILNMVKRSQEY